MFRLYYTYCTCLDCTLLVWTVLHLFRLTASSRVNTFLLIFITICDAQIQPSSCNPYIHFVSKHLEKMPLLQKSTILDAVSLISCITLTVLVWTVLHLFKLHYTYCTCLDCTILVWTVLHLFGLYYTCFDCITLVWTVQHLF